MSLLAANLETRRENPAFVIISQVPSSGMFISVGGLKPEDRIGLDCSAQSGVPTAFYSIWHVGVSPQSRKIYEVPIQQGHILLTTMAQTAGVEFGLHSNIEAPLWIFECQVLLAH